MRLARVLLAVFLVGAIAISAVAFTAGVWPLGIVMGVCAVALGLTLAWSWTGPREYRTGEYVESDRSFY